ncbi:MAG: hypothetical protein AAFZ18_28435 [Myxococcota bacterium]
MLRSAAPIALLAAACGDAPVAGVGAAPDRGGVLVVRDEDALSAVAYQGSEWNLEIPPGSETQLAWLQLPTPLAEAGLRAGVISRPPSATEQSRRLGEIEIDEVRLAEWTSGPFDGWTESPSIPTWAATVEIAVSSGCPESWDISRVEDLKGISTVLPDGRFLVERADGEKATLGPEVGAEAISIDGIPREGRRHTFRGEWAVERNGRSIYRYEADGRWSLAKTSTQSTGWELDDFAAFNGELWATAKEDRQLRQLRLGTRIWASTGELLRGGGLIYADAKRGVIWISHPVEGSMERLSPERGAPERVVLDLAGSPGDIWVRQFTETSYGLLGSMSSSSLITHRVGPKLWEVFPGPVAVEGATSVLELRPGWLVVLNLDQLTTYRPMRAEDGAFECEVVPVDFGRPKRAFASQGVILAAIGVDVVRFDPRGAGW